MESGYGGSLVGKATRGPENATLSTLEEGLKMAMEYKLHMVAHPEAYWYCYGSQSDQDAAFLPLWNYLRSGSAR